jgi:dienelactone hydrolase
MAWRGAAGRVAQAALVLLAAGLAAAEPVPVPSLDAPAGTPVALPGHWFPVSRPGLAPAMLLLHGCSGVADRQGALAERYGKLAAHLNALGIHALATDSLSPRGERELCTQAQGSRRVTQLQRRRDALGALQWLAAQPGVDPARLGVLGWSNGGSTVLAATNRRHREVAAAAVLPSLAVAFYPGCEAELQRGYRPAAPLLLLLGEADDWTPPAPCKALAAAAAAGDVVQWVAYPGAVHGFDGSGPVRLRRDVPGGVRPGQGVHVGGDAAARAASALRLDQFLRAQWALTP